MDERPWVQKEIDRLMTIIPKPGDCEESAKQIAERVGRLKKILSFSDPDKLPKDRMNQIFKWHDDGMDVKDIGKTIGASVKTVNMFLKYREPLTKYYQKKEEEQ